MLRPRRLTALLLVVLSIYICVTIWQADTDLGNVLYRVWENQGLDIEKNQSQLRTEKCSVKKYSQSKFIRRNQDLTWDKNWTQIRIKLSSPKVFLLNKPQHNSTCLRRGQKVSLENNKSPKRKSKSKFRRYINGLPNSTESVLIACYYKKDLNSLRVLDDDVRTDGCIFFMETSCHDTPRPLLSPRQACAVESAAKMNPELDVYVLFPSPVIDNSSIYSQSVHQLMTYPNVKLRHVNMDEYFRDTPLEKWYASGMLRTSRWPRSHASDILRYLTLWKFGGIYLDLDVVVTKKLSDVVNFAGAESSEDVAAGVLSFSHEGVGHDLATSCVERLRRHFKGYDWGNNGPGIITKILQRTCGTENVNLMTPERCLGFKVFPPKTFYPIPWRKWRLYFNATNSNATMRMLAESRAIHVWNKFSSAANVTVGSAQPYGIVASRHCPRVYSSVGTVF